MPWLYLAIAITAEIIGTSALTASEGFSRPLPAAVSMAAFLVAFYFLALTLQIIPMGITYAVWSGIGIVAISVIGWLVFQQSLDAPALVGIALIVAGVIVINTLSGTTSR